MGITHVLADGTVVNSIAGMVIPAGNRAYAIIAKAAEKQNKEKQEAKGA